MKVSIIGAGVMGKIFLASALKVFPKARLIITDRDAAKLKKIKKEFPRAAVSLDNRSAIAQASLIILAVKPQSFDEAARGLKGRLSARALVLSIMAGVTSQKIQKQLGVKKIIRAMPNLGARVNKSMTVWFSSGQVSALEKKMVRLLFRGMGQELFVRSEAMINKATAVSGSGPGFFFFLVEGWLKAIQKLGFSLSESKELLFNTLEASNELLLINGDPSELKNQVASKGGTTEAGLKVMAKNGVERLWPKVLAAAYKRSQELSK